MLYVQTVHSDIEWFDFNGIKPGKLSLLASCKKIVIPNQVLPWVREVLPSLTCPYHCARVWTSTPRLYPKRMAWLRPQVSQKPSFIHRLPCCRMNDVDKEQDSHSCMATGIRQVCYQNSEDMSKWSYCIKKQINPCSKLHLQKPCTTCRSYSSPFHRHGVEELK
jgi:hypothetical protein